MKYLKSVSIIIVFIFSLVNAQNWDSMNQSQLGTAAVPSLADRWDDRFITPAISGTIYTMAVYGNYLLVGGDFNFADGVLVPGVAVWDGSNWHGINFNNNNYPCNYLYVHQNDIYLCMQNGLFRLNNLDISPNWESLQPEFILDGNIYGMIEYNGKLYIGGWINFNGENHSILVMENDSVFTLPEEPNFSVYSFTKDSSTLYVGGFFNKIGNSDYFARIAALDSSGWKSLMNSRTSNSVVYSLFYRNDSLFIGAADGFEIFSLSSGELTHYSVFNGNLGGIIHSITEWNQDIYLGGLFDTIDNTPVSNIARWDGTAIQTVGNMGTNRRVRALTVYNNNLVIGGDFSFVSNLFANKLVEWDGTSFNGNFYTLNTIGLAGEGVFDVEMWNDKVFLGGSFSGIWGRKFNSNLCYWDGTQFIDPLSDAPPVPIEVPPNSKSLLSPQNIMATDNAPVIRDIYPDSTNLLFAGIYESSSASEYGVFELQNTLQPLGQSNFGEGYALIRHQGKLYGAFRTNNYNYQVSEWDGLTWNNLNGIFNNEIRKLVVYHDTLYAVGFFTQIDNQPIAYMARWNGTQWESIGIGPDNMVDNATVFNGKLYVAGMFRTINGVNCPYIASFDGNQWTPELSDNSYLSVSHHSGLLVREYGIYYGNYVIYNKKPFIFGHPVNGYENAIFYSIIPSPNDSLLYVGGQFQGIDGKASQHFGIYRINHYPQLNFPDLTLQEDFGQMVVDLSNYIQDQDNDPVAISSITVLDSDLNLSADFTFQEAQLILTSKVNQFGADTLSINISDPPFIASDTLILTVLPVNDAPVTPSVLSPTNNANISTPQIEFRWTDSYDVDNDSIWYFIKIFSDSLQTDTTIINIPANSYVFDGVNFFQNNSQYGWIVGVTDGMDTSLSDTAYFVYNLPNSIKPQNQIPEEFALQKIYPNPFNPTVTFLIDIPVESELELKIFNIMGQQISTLIKTLNPGTHRIQFDAKNSNYGSLSSGVYIYKIHIKDRIGEKTHFSKTGKIVFMK